MLADVNIPKSARAAFNAHKTSAASRAIPFQLTIEEWWTLWQPYWPARELGAALHMCRTADQGAYALGNVRIDTASANAREAKRGPAVRNFYVLTLGSGKTLPDRVARLEVRAMRRALDVSQYNISAAARALGISFRQMRYLLKKHAKVRK